jgi:molybdopterin molybdotransferase
MTTEHPSAWEAARAASYAAGRAVAPDPVEVPLTAADGHTLAAPLTTLTALPAFPMSSVDGYAARGAGPWQVVGQLLAGAVPDPLDQDTAVQIATGAWVPPGTEHIVRVEDAGIDEQGRVSGKGRAVPDWRDIGDEAAAGEELLPAGTPVTPAVIGLAAACGYNSLAVRPPVRTAVVVFGDELLTVGPPGQGRVRDSLGPQLPGWLRRLGADPVPGFDPNGPIQDTLAAHVDALKHALDHADLICTTGGTMRGPVDHLHSALTELGAKLVVDTVAVRPGFPMLIAEFDGGKFVAGLPGNPQSAVVAVMSLVVPLLHGLAGRPAPSLAHHVELGGPIAGRGDFTHLALVRLDPDGIAHPLSHAASAMLRGLARADGFAVVVPGTSGEPGTRVPFLPLPLTAGSRP